MLHVARWCGCYGRCRES